MKRLFFLFLFSVLSSLTVSAQFNETSTADSLEKVTRLAKRIVFIANVSSHEMVTSLLKEGKELPPYTSRVTTGDKSVLLFKSLLTGDPMMQLTPIIKNGVPSGWSLNTSDSYNIRITKYYGDGLVFSITYWDGTKTVWTAGSIESWVIKADMAPPVTPISNGSIELGLILTDHILSTFLSARIITNSEYNNQ